MAFQHMQSGFPMDENGRILLVPASQAVAPIVTQGGLKIDALGRVVIPG